MSAHPPPIPPDQRPTQGPKSDGKVQAGPQGGDKVTQNGNVDEQGQTGASKQNTTNKGYQQDR